MAKPIELSEKDIRRFFSKVWKKGEDDCWLWRGRTNDDCYGRFDIESGSLLAHRIAYFLYYQIDPDCKLVCHTCDTPRCCNPKHLILGTKYSNAQDAMSKGRHSSQILLGSKRPNAKLTAEKVLEIRNKRILGMTFEAIAEQYQIHFSTVMQIINRKTWRHI